MPHGIVIPTNSPNVLLRQLQPEDARSYFNLITENHEYFELWGQLTNKCPSLESVQASILERDSGRIRFGIRFNDEFAGVINLTPRRPFFLSETHEIGYLVGERFTGKRVATHAATALSKFAFESLGSKLLCGLVDRGNLASQKVLMNAGYEITFKDATTAHFFRRPR